MVINSLRNSKHHELNNPSLGRVSQQGQTISNISEQTAGQVIVPSVLYLAVRMFLFPDNLQLQFSLLRPPTSIKL